MNCRLNFLLLFTLSTVTVNAQLVINEIMQSNIDCLMDDANEFPDSWVELYNAGSTNVNLSSYKIGNTNQVDKAWPLPSRQLTPHKHIVIYCDKEAKGYHTDFKLDSDDGGSLYLFYQGSITDQLTNIPSQPAPNISYGRLLEDSDVWGYQASPTPANPNCGRFSNTILDNPEFSVKGKVFTSAQTVTLQLSLPGGCPEGTVIRYTTNGSEPTENSTIYTNPLRINSTTTVRAKLFCEGFLSPRSTTHSYLFLNRQMTLPVISIVTDNRYFYDSKIGIYVDGSYKSGSKNYSFDWRRPINIEYFEQSDQESAINQLCETRVQGGASRGSQLKSLVVYANKRFGKKRLKYEFFPDQKPGLDKFKSIILRNAGNDFDYLYMRDAIIQRVMAKNTDLDWQAWRPAIIFINGVYKGILNIRERSTADNIYTNYNGLEDIDMLENWTQLKEGDTKHWERFKEFYNEKGHSLDEYSQWIDWKEFLNLMLMNLFFNNQDFPGNNIVMWRPRTPNGVWRFVAKDTDFGLGLYGSPATYNSIEWIYNPDYDNDRNWANKYEHTRLFRRLMEVPEFKMEFIDRATVYMGDFLNSGGVREIWDPMYEYIKTEYPYHRKLINQWWPNYTNELQSARRWLEERPNIFYQHLSNFYHLGSPIPVEINLNVDEEARNAVQFNINGVSLTRSTFNGCFYSGRNYTLSSVPLQDLEVTGWRVIEVGKNGGPTKDRTEKGPNLSFEMPESQKLIIEALIGPSNGIDDIATATLKWHYSDGILRLTNLEENTEIAIFNLQGTVIKKTMSNGREFVIQLPCDKTYIVKVGTNVFKIR